MGGAFFVALLALWGFIGSLLWFTGWAEKRVISGDRELLPARHR